MRSRRNRSLRSRWWLLAAALAALIVVVGVVFALGSVLLPEAFPPPQSTKILAADGKLIDTLHGEEDRTLVPLDQISVALREAVVATEDRSFFEHQGVSLRAIFRAVFTNVRRGEVAQGGSTITQQYVRNRYEEVGRERTIFRKIREAVMAVKIERRYSKTKILEFYLNTVYFGRGAYGAEAAATTYFKKPAKDLTISEAAYLAGVIRAPQLHQPDTQPKRAEQVRKKVIRDMVNAGYIEEEEATKAEQDLPKFSLGPPGATGAAGGRAAFFVEYVRRLLLSEFKITERDVLTGGLVVHTTLDLRMQAAAEKAISSTLDKPDDPEAALVAMEPGGSIRAMVGGRDFTNVERARGFNFAIQKGGKTGGRQAGSAFKPFTLATFLDEGYSVSSKFLGPAKITIPSAQCKDEKGKPWEVSNFDSEAFGESTVVEATASSVNTIYAQMVDLVKAKKVRDLGEKAGPWDLKAVCSLALGTSVVTPLEMAQAFSTFAAHGNRPEPVAITKIVTPDGRVLAETKPESDEAMEPKVADGVTQVLTEVIKKGTGTGAAIGRPAAGKTGTTQNHVDAWFVGYTPNLVASVWMGFPPKDGKIPEMTKVHGRAVTGGSFPATIWKKFMTDALKGTKAQNFTSVSLEGNVVTPTPCPPDVTPGPQSACVLPSPSPSPAPSPSVEPSPSPKASPEPTSSPSPTPTPSPSPSGPSPPAP